MKIISAEYTKSFFSLETVDLAPLPQFAFIGRSNVGKSSLINHLLNRKNLVKTSSTPGKTRMMNYFLINNSFYIVDLPGYGFARGPKAEAQSWREMIYGYLFNCKDLKLIFQLVDIRHQPSKEDVAFHQSLKEGELPYRLIANKADKIGKNQQQKMAAQIKKALGPAEPPIIHSAPGKIGRDPLLSLINSKL